MTEEGLLKGMVAVVTGASMGIGKGIARALATAGSHLVLAARTKSRLEEARNELKALGSTVEIFQADVSRETEARRLVEFALDRFDGINCLVNCAGIQGPIGRATDVDTSRWLEVIHTNLFGTFLCIKAVLPHMMENGSGKIINLSGGGATSPRPRFSAYGASKAAVVRLTETLAEEVREYNIQINAIAPGAVNTRMLTEILDAGEAAGSDGLAKAIRQDEEGGVPPERVGELAVFLASPRSDGLSGKLISLLWDDWRDMPKQASLIMSSDVYTMRRITPEDREHDWRVSGVR